MHKVAHYLQQHINNATERSLTSAQLVYVVMCRLGCSGFTFTLRDRPSRSPLDGDITELMRETLVGDFTAAATAAKQSTTRV